MSSECGVVSEGRWVWLLGEGRWVWPMSLELSGSRGWRVDGCVPVCVVEDHGCGQQARVDGCRVVSEG